MTLAAGTRLGPYEILGPIGAGGMGEVYRAKDPRLAREVAIKVLPASFSQDSDRLRRFEQEAKAAGVLNHPNITAVYDIGTSSDDGAPYVVQELLEGETLRSELAGGKLSPRKAVDYATQIAEGLAAAHEKGIVHRDLKPENLFVTRDGRLKILDFGLAKLTQPDGSSSAVTNLPTETRGTEPGVVLGTLGYMSPEQVRGKNADARSDIFSFGAILYEMLSGQRAFRGDTAADTMSAILKEDPPDLSVTNQSISPGLERIIRHCLEKNPERRFQSARDLAFNLGELSGVSGTSAATASRPHSLPWWPIIGAVALMAAFAAGHFVWKPPAASTPIFRRLTFRRGNLGTARFAPDGHGVVYGASWEGAPLEIYTTRPEGPESTPIGVKNADLFSVSPSGELAISLRGERFLAGPAGVGTLATVPIGGGAPRPIAEFIERAAWTPDGKQLAIVRFLDGHYRIELPLGKTIYTTEHRITVPRISPRGDRIAFLERALGVYSIRVADLQGKSATLAESIRGQGLAWGPSGEEVWYDDRGERGQYLLKAVTLAGRERVLATLPVGLIVHDVSRDGRLLVERYDSKGGISALAAGAARERDLTWFDRSNLVALSDDGRFVLLNEFGDASGAAGAFYLRGTDGSPAVKLGEGTALDLSADGRWVLSRKADSSPTFVLTPTGTGTALSIDEPALPNLGGALLFPDGKRLLFQGAEQGQKRRLYVQDLPSGKPRAVSTANYGFGSRPISPDGQWIVAYGEWSEDVFVVPVSGGEPRTIAHSKDLDILQWSPDGKSLYAAIGGSIPAQLMRVDIATGKREPWKDVAPPDLSGLIEISPVCVTPDGKSYAYGYGRAATSDLYLIEGLK
ncbi:MAG TPA: protein kinase [Thermoanaerobaculia bacterium]|jgi:Tol biopolymer transport system component